jgi:hypothetical protein
MRLANLGLLGIGLLLCACSGPSGSNPAPLPPPTNAGPARSSQVRVPPPTAIIPEITIFPAAVDPTAPAPAPAPTEAVTPTALPSVTAAPAPASPVATLKPGGALAAASGNLRAGPGTDYPVVGQVDGGQALRLKARSPDGAWYETAEGAWIFGGLVSGAEPLPVAAKIPTRPVAQVVVSTAVPAPTAPATGAACPAWYQPPEPGKGVMLFENHNTFAVNVEEVDVRAAGGGTGRVNVDIKVGDQPGRHAFQLDPGRHTFRVDAPNVEQTLVGLDVEAGHAYQVPFLVVVGESLNTGVPRRIKRGDVHVYPLDPPAGCS